jgi:Na+-transporting NADH:ubiquinone oxidoreductase, subunit NqrF
MTLTILGISVFTGIILILVLILNFAESKLLPKGDVIIKINGDDDKVITTRPGGTLLSTLANENIFLPSACGRRPDLCLMSMSGAGWGWRNTTN